LFVNLLFMFIFFFLRCVLGLLITMPLTIVSRRLTSRFAQFVDPLSKPQSPAHVRIPDTDNDNNSIDNENL
jgi:hypothetical protein